MLITVKILKGGECTLEVSSSASIRFVKQLVTKELEVPVSQQRLVFQGKTLLDNDSLCDYNIIDGSKLFLFINEESAPPSGEFWELLQKFLERHFTPEDSTKVVIEFRKILYEQVAKLSLDDIERLAIMNLEEERALQESSS